MRRRLVLIVALMPILAACGSTDKPSSTAAQSSTTTSVVASSSTSSTTVAPSVVLQNNGLKLNDQTLVFNTATQEATRAALDKFAGVAKTGSNTCAEGGFTYDYATYPDIEVVFEKGKLTGWNVHSGTYNTPSGVHIGTPRSNLLSIYKDATVDDKSTVGPVWSYNGIAGAFTNDKVSFIYAGTTCIIT